MKGYYIGILLALSLLVTFPSQAQKTIKGKVVDEKKTPIEKVRVSINRSDYVYTQPNGEFTIKSGLSTDEDPTVVTADKDGLIIKDWIYSEGKINVIMSMPLTIRGRVISNREVPISGINVLLIGIRGLEAVKTNKQGYFSLVVPEDTKIDENSSFVVFDPGRLRGRADYRIQMVDNLVYLIVDIPPKPVRTVKVMDETGTPLKDITVVIDQIRHLTNANGEFKPQENANDFSGYFVEEFLIAGLDYEDLSSTMKITVRKPLANEPVNEGVVTIIDDKKESIFEERVFIEENLDSLRSRVLEIEGRLGSDANITPEERRQLELTLAGLQSEILQNEKALAIAREKAEKTILELEQAFTSERIKGLETQRDLERAKREKKLIEDKAELSEKVAFRTNLIFAIIAIAMVSIAIVILINNRKISKQRNQIKEANAELLDKKNQLEEKNNKITDSIRYAQTIQQSILPNQRAIATSLSEFFIFYEPRDIVSGDFYWFSRKGNNLIIAAADCTGHGVPGAFMTMMGNTLLNQIVNENDETDPAKILTTLNEQVRNTLNQKEKEKAADRAIDGDGMDIVLVNLDLRAGKVTYAGAKNPLYYITKGGELVYHKGTNLSIGSTLSKTPKEFKNIEIVLEGGEVFYLVSDGFQDQLGGEHVNAGGKRKKYMKTRFMDLLTKCSAYPMNKQKEIFESEFRDWKRDTPQTDDIVLLGFRI